MRRGPVRGVPVGAFLREKAATLLTLPDAASRCAEAVARIARVASAPYFRHSGMLMAYASSLIVSAAMAPRYSIASCALCAAVKIAFGSSPSNVSQSAT